MSDDTEVIELLSDEFSDALLGGYFMEDGTPIPAYSSAIVMERLIEAGHDEQSAMETIEAVTEGMRMIWIHELVLEPEFTPDNKPHLRLVH